MKSQAKEGPKGGRMVVEQGAHGGRMTGSEGIRASKDNMPDVKLGEGLEMGSVHKAHKKGLVNGLGGKQAMSPANSGESDHETLRHGSKPKPESVQNAPKHNQDVLKRARMFNVRSEQGGAEKEGGW